VHEQELAIAAEIQSTLLLGQSPEDIPGVCITAYTASSAKIDGDFYHFFVYNDQHFDIAVGDVMGKGIPAAVLGAAVKSSIQKSISRSLVDVRGSFPRPDAIVGRVHSEMAEHLIRLGTFVTLAYAHVDMETSQIHLVDCGHTRLVHYKASEKTCDMLQGDNMPLGVVEEETHISMSTKFGTGDILVFYSDGLTEAENVEGEQFGEDRLAEVVARCHDCDTEGIVAAARNAVQSFTGTSVITDDMTCVVMKFGQPVKSERHEAVLDIASSVDHLQEVGDFVRTFLGQSTTAAEADIDAMELVVNEAVVNVIEHAYNAQSGHPISIHGELTPSSITIRVYDWAEPFDASGALPPSFDGSRYDGFGLFIIEQNTSSATYMRDLDGRNCGTFVRKIPFLKENN
jgi:sigma-B regulation protein RsbU (phosphoserine phosphatase)